MTQIEIPLTDQVTDQADSGVETDVESDPSRKRYAHPRPLIHRAIKRLTMITLLVAGLAIIAQIGLALLFAPLLLGTAFFTAVLMLPLWLQSVLHPEVITTSVGFTLQPMIGRAQFVHWEAVQALLPHPLIYNDPVVGKHLRGKHYEPRTGAIIVVSREAGLSPRYRLIGLIAGNGGQPAFAISSTTHTDYAELLTLFRAQSSG